ncbi:hypothetical protein [Tumebacillus flagellatus]|uniref:Uncharacterized protein n=1 Tax=Tumebacillus flagellatus TaxID=1157490 RepID=A0A074LYP5_9BACL|nr:hypothetical protein [Tumebacillus flagellatus]KEO85138.1 hypothetical protein EL26_00845 [Tumebacillus flagellatus]
MKTTKVAILITHGVGEQGELDTLDLFARNLVQSLQDSRGEGVQLTHRRLHGAQGMEEYVQLTDRELPGWEVDLHEFYWAPLVERQISFREILEWLEAASNGVDRPEVGWALRGMSRLGSLGEKLMPAWLDGAYRLAMGKAEELVVDTLGDVAVYTASDLRSKWHGVREEVLQGALQKVLTLLNLDYDRVILIGHSLGSVVLYDALNRLNLYMNDDAVLAAKRHKLYELITLGSPLDLTALYLSEQIGEGEYVKRLILDHVNGFRRRWPQPQGPRGTVLRSTVQDWLTELRWTNYWDLRDPLAGPLVHYWGVENVQTDNGLAWGLAHTGYFDNLQIYRDAVLRAASVEQAAKTEPSAERHLRAI